MRLGEVIDRELAIDREFAAARAGVVHGAEVIGAPPAARWCRSAAGAWASSAPNHEVVHGAVAIGAVVD